MITFGLSCSLQALSGVGETIQERASITDNTALTAAMNTQFLLQIGIFTAVPMILGLILEQGFLKVNKSAARTFSFVLEPIFSSTVICFTFIQITLYLVIALVIFFLYIHCHLFVQFHSNLHFSGLSTAFF